VLAGDDTTFEDGLGIIHYCRLGDLLHYSHRYMHGHTHKYQRSPMGVNPCAARARKTRKREREIENIHRNKEAKP